MKKYAEEHKAQNEALPIDPVSRISFAPNVPPPIDRHHPARVVVDISSDDVILPVSGEYKYPFWTFSGHIPGPFIRCRVGDVLEVHHTNNDSSGVAHNIDFHGVAGKPSNKHKANPRLWIYSRPPRSTMQFVQ
jgi:nitrite reductase (NO-forming)